MALVTQWSVKWSGLTGLPGYSFFYSSSNTTGKDALTFFFDGIKAFFPTPLKWEISPFWKDFDVATGKMVNEGGGGVLASINATAANSYAPQAGAQVKWSTGGFSNGRHVVGRTYLVPLVASQLTTGGLITATCANTIAAAADAVRGSWGGQQVIWSRPLFETGADGKPTDVIKRAGTIHTVVTVTVPTKMATLNSRRDT